MEKFKHEHKNFQSTYHTLLFFRMKCIRLVFKWTINICVCILKITGKWLFAKIKRTNFDYPKCCLPVVHQNVWVWVIWLENWLFVWNWRELELIYFTAKMLFKKVHREHDSNTWLPQSMWWYSQVFDTAIFACIPSQIHIVPFLSFKMYQIH